MAERSETKEPEMFQNRRLRSMSRNQLVVHLMKWQKYRTDIIASGGILESDEVEYIEKLQSLVNNYPKDSAA